MAMLIPTAMGTSMAVVERNRMSIANRGLQPEAEFENIVAHAFRQAGWGVRRHTAAGAFFVDLVVKKGTMKYVVDVKSASEGRRDRMIPLLSQAILQAQSYARQFAESAAPLAIVAARHVPATVADHIKQFAERHAPDVAIGVVDAEGFRSFKGPGLERLNGTAPIGATRQRPSSRHIPDLFTDLNQWMLKILVGRSLSEELIATPREPIRNASHLAEVADVSIMSASRLMNQLASEGFLEKYREHLQLVRTDELFERWTSANRKNSQDLPLRFIIKKDQMQFFASVAQYAAEARMELPLTSTLRNSRVLKPQPRCCVGLFSAADALGLGFVRGVLPHLYLERLDPDALRKLGLSIEDSNRRADIHVRVPCNKESTFRPSVMRNGLPVSDVLQVWLDTAIHPTRGREQADEIWRRVLKPIFAKRP